MPVKRQIPAGDWDDYYRQYQETLANRYLIPRLSSWGIALSGLRVLEVGCGDGGCGAAFYKAGARVVMMDVDERLVAIAKAANARQKLDIPTFAGDVFDANAEFYRGEPFDIVLFRDVMEHLEDPAEALRVVGRHLRPTGHVFVVFPPYYSPFGAHQQIAPRKTFAGIPYNKFPYIQMLPKRWFLRIASGDTPANREVMRLRDVRLTVKKFERAVTEAAYTIDKRKMYLSRPTFALRYGLPVIPAPLIGNIPLLREMMVTAAYYLLGRK
jgi:SAM-dependent methyltransferase